MYMTTMLSHAGQNNELMLFQFEEVILTGFLAQEV